MKKLLGAALAAASAVLVAGAAAGAGNAASGPRSEHGTAARTHAFLAALEREDIAAVQALIDPGATLTHAMALSGDRDDAARFEGRDQVLGYIRGVFAIMGRVDFTGVRVTVSGDGRTSFAQAEGDFLTADGRPYENVYLFRFDWRNGRVLSTTEYANPVTFCETFDSPDC
jgi:ketosteroid isomerase-like protein